jgi:hypothetical protein
MAQQGPKPTKGLSTASCRSLTIFGMYHAHSVGGTWGTVGPAWGQPKVGRVCGSSVCARTEVITSVSEVCRRPFA